jgi:transcription initiation factor TFIID TATA-box-binding protein
MTDPQDSIKIENVVASSNIGQELALESLAMDLEGADYDPEKLPGSCLSYHGSQICRLNFPFRKIVCTGANSVENVYESLKIVFEELSDLHIEVEEDPEITVQNIVSSADLGRNLNSGAGYIGWLIAFQTCRWRNHRGSRLTRPLSKSTASGLGRTLQ